MNLFGSVNLIANPNQPTASGGTSGSLIPAQIWWLSDVSDWRFVWQWRASLSLISNPVARDALEYAELAGKRWRFLMRQKASVAGWETLREHLIRDPVAEVGMALALTHTVAGETLVLGFGFIRRTWANNLILEFLAGSPTTLTNIKGVGAALMQSIASIGVWLSAGELWGECTAASRGFYRKLKESYFKPANDAPAGRQTPSQMTDRFQFDGEELRLLAASSPVEIEPCPSPGFKA